MTVKNGRIALCLGAVSALGPLGTDTYLAALPQIAGDLNTSDGDIQMSVMTFFLGFTIGQLFYGPMSDKTGRKPMIYLALGLFAIGSLGCLVAGSSTTLTAWRLVQGLGGSVGSVIGMAIVRDLFTGAEAARLMALVMLVMALAPILAPLLGSLILQLGNWRLIFVMLTAFSLLTIAMIALLLPETHTRERRTAGGTGNLLQVTGRLFTSRDFIPYATVRALVQGGFFAYIAGSSFVFINVCGLSPLAYSILFAFNAVGLSIGGQVSARIVGRFSPHAVSLVATIAYAACGIVLLAVEFSGFSNAVTLGIALFATVTAFGAVMPNISLIAMEANGPVAGTAAALMGAMGFGAGALASALLGVFDNGTAVPMIALIAGSGILAVAIDRFSFHAAPRPAGAQGGVRRP